jgi:predicted nuclease of predicted toxin-antitoxin system
MVRLLADENFPVTLALRVSGIDVLTAAEAALLRTPDASVLAAAKALGRAVLTQDRDYLLLHKSAATHAGIVLTTKDDDFPALATRVAAAIAGQTDLTGQLIRVYRPNPPPPKVP